MERKSLVITLSILLGLNSAVLADYLGIHLPLARQIFGFLALTFLPGYLLLNIFRTKLESLSERIFLSVALSISTVMFIGVFVNFIYPYLGIEKPITLDPILMTFNAVMMALLYTQQKRAIYINWTCMELKITRWDLFFSLLPLVSLLSAYRFSFYGDNRGLLVLYFVISLTPIIFVGVRDFNRTFAIWSIAISLMWSTVFGMSWNYIWGYDINGEYYYANLVLSRGIWHVSTFSQYNTVASVNLLAPIYSIILNITIISVFKIIYPLLFSLVPIILLRAYEKLLNKKIWAELSVLFIIFFFQFFFNTMALARMMIVEMYLALLVYATAKRLSTMILLLLLASLVISHYGTAYLVMFALLALIPLSKLRLRIKISVPVVAFFWTMTLLWYQYVGGGFEFYKLANIGYQTILMLKYILNPRYSQGLAIIVSKTTPLREIAKWINLVAQGLITVGILSASYHLVRKKSTKYLEFYMISMVFFAYDIAGVVVPFFANRMNVNRLYHLTQFFIAPYLLIGLSSIMKVLNFNKNQYASLLGNNMKIAGVFLLVYFIFTSGWALVILNDPHPPIWLEKTDGPYWSSSEIYGGKWIKNYKDDEPIYADINRVLLFLGLLGQPIGAHMFIIDSKNDIIQPNQELHSYYFFLGKWNLEYRKLDAVVASPLGGRIAKIPISIVTPRVFKIFLYSNKIYSSQNAQCFKYFKTQKLKLR